MHSAAELDMQRYYAQRVHEYERIYAKPERQADLAAIKAWLPAQFDEWIEWEHFWACTYQVM